LAASFWTLLRLAAGKLRLRFLNNLCVAENVAIRVLLRRQLFESVKQS